MHRAPDHPLDSPDREGASGKSVLKPVRRKQSREPPSQPKPASSLRPARAWRSATSPSSRTGAAEARPAVASGRAAAGRAGRRGRRNCLTVLASAWMYLEVAHHLQSRELERVLVGGFYDGYPGRDPQVTYFGVMSSLLLRRGEDRWSHTKPRKRSASGRRRTSEQVVARTTWNGRGAAAVPSSATCREVPCGISTRSGQSPFRAVATGPKGASSSESPSLRPASALHRSGSGGHSGREGVVRALIRERFGHRSRGGCAPLLRKPGWTLKRSSLRTCAMPLRGRGAFSLASGFSR